MSVSAAQSIRKAERCAKAGDVAAAVILYRSVLEKFPENRRAAQGLRALHSSAKNERGAQSAAPPEQLRALIVLVNAGKFDAAIKHAEAVLEQFPLSCEAYNIIAVAHAKLGRLEDAVASCRQALAVNPDFVDACNNLGGALKGLGRYSDAIDAYKKAVTISPTFADAHNNLGAAYSDLGQKKEAIASYQRAIVAKPDFARAHHYLSDIKNYDASDPQIGQMSRLLERGDLADADRARLHFALGKAMDDLQRYEEAFAHFADGNRIRKTLTGYSIEEDRMLFSKIKAAHEAAPAPEDLAAASDLTPIFIVGMPRSGTSLVEQILSSHSQVFGIGEVDWLEREIDRAGGVETLQSTSQFVEIGRKYRKRVSERAGGAAFVTDKLPINFRWIGVIRRALPDARIICVERDPRAVCWSLFRRSFAATKGNGYADDLADLADYCCLFIDLMTFWRQAFPGEVHRFKYERLTERQEAETHSLLEYIGLDWEDQCLAFHQTRRPVATASSMQVRSKIYRGSSNAWKQYEAYLGPLIDRLPLRQ